MRSMVMAALAALCLLAAPQTALAVDPEVAELLKEIKALKARVLYLEKRLEQVDGKAQQANKLAEQAHAGSLKISRQIAEDKAPAKGFLSDLENRVKVYGALEVEASYESKKPKHGRSSDNSDIKLATAEVFFEARVNKYTRGLLHFLWEQGSTEPVDLDEGFIVIGDTADMPFYAMAGRVYPAVAQFQTYMVSDPVTQNVFETQATSVEGGYSGDWLEAGAGVYNSSVSERGDGGDDLINSYYLFAHVHTPEGALGALSVKLGGAYMNNAASTDFLGEHVPGEKVDSLAGAWSASVMADYKWLSFVAEYMAAIDDFKAGELGFNPGSKASPKAWYLELAVSPFKQWTFAARYEGTEDLFNQEPERQWGLTATWAFLKNTSISLEYLRGDFEDQATRDLITSQLAVSF